VTGEEVLELHIHGGPATVKAVLRAIPRCPSNCLVRYAEPGEFTRRAFQNDRLDLAQVEALSDTLSAETEQQRRAAVRGNSGSLGKTYDEWRHMLLYARGELEAIIDFSEDQDFDVSSSEMLQSIESQIQAMQRSIALHMEASRRGELLRKGIRISLLGHPNAGKSSLLNRIVGREASIVSTEAGTTRDIVEVSLDIEGYLCTIADTAGLRTLTDASNIIPQTTDNNIGTVELEGIRRAKEKAKDSDLVIVLASVEQSSDNIWEIQCDMDALQIASEAQSLLVVVNKMDVVSEKILHAIVEQFRHFLIRQVPAYRHENLAIISCKDAQELPPVQNPGNIKHLVDLLVQSFQGLTGVEHDDLFGVTERQRQLLGACTEQLYNYLQETKLDHGDDSCDIVLAAEHLRSAANCLSRITGRGDAGDVEEVLGVVFEKY